MPTDPIGILIELSAPAATTLRVVVTQPLVVGREGTGLRIPDAKVSRRHIEVRPDGDGVMVTDLGSTNGTYLNGTRMTGQGRVGRGDRQMLRRGGTITVMFSDIADSAALATEMGDEAWLAVLQEHEGLVRGAVADGGAIHTSDLVFELTRSLPDMPLGPPVDTELKGLGPVVTRPVLWEGYTG